MRGSINAAIVFAGALTVSTYTAIPCCGGIQYFLVTYTDTDSTVLPTATTEHLSYHGTWYFGFICGILYAMRCLYFDTRTGKRNSSVCQYKLATKAPIILLSRSILSGSRLGKTNASTGTVIPPSVRIKRMSPNL